jgi:hypothetical protein
LVQLRGCNQVRKVAALSERPGSTRSGCNGASEEKNLRQGRSILGADFLERLEPARLTRQLVKRLEALGHKVTLEPCPAV